MNKLSKHHGFTLLEIAVVMTIISLLIGGMLIPLGTRLNEQAYIDTQAKLDKVNEAIVGFAILNRRLPCPGDLNGAEQLQIAAGAGVVCGSTLVSDSSSTADSNTSWGIVPWQALGLNETDVTDAWTYRIRYSVRTRLVLADSLNQTNLAPGTSIISTNPTGISVRPTDATVVAQSLTTTALYVLHSTGQNAIGANRTGTNPLLATSYTAIPATISADEQANLPRAETTAALRSTFVSHVRTTTTSSLGEFDDLLIWMSPTTLTAKLVAAGVWIP